MNYCDNVAKQAYEQDKTLDVRFNQRPFKNIALSNSNYTVYTVTVGREKNNVVGVNFFVNNNGYVSYLTVGGNVKNNKQKGLLGDVTVLLSVSCGFLDLNSLISSFEKALGNNPVLDWKKSYKIPNANKYIHFNGKSYKLDSEYNFYEVEIFATNDGKF